MSRRLSNRFLAPVILATGLAALAPRAAALDSRRALTQHVLDVWRTEQGLPLNSVQVVAQTKDGYLWIGTQGGLTRFDGVRFVTFDARTTPAVARSSVVRLLETRDGSLIAGTDGGGLCRLKNGVFTREGPRDAVVRALHEDSDGALLVGTDTGIFRHVEGSGVYEPFGVKEGLVGSKIRAIHRDASGTLWVGTRDAGLARLDGSRFRMLGRKDGLLSDSVSALASGPDGTLFVGTDLGLQSLSGGVFTSYAGREGAPKEYVWTLDVDPGGAVFAGTDGEGLVRFARGAFTRLGVRHGLPSESVRALARDREGSLWLGLGSGGGLARLKDGKVLVVGAPEGVASDVVWSVLEDRAGAVWLGTNAGASRVLGTDVTTLRKADGLSDERVLSVFEDSRGDVWLGTWSGGVNRVSDGKVTTLDVKDGLVDDMVRAIVEDAKGDLWFGTNGGLTRLSGGELRSFTAKDGLGGDAVYGLHAAKDGSLLVGTEGGLTRLKDGVFTTKTTKDGLASDFVLSFLEDEGGIVWVGTDGGGIGRLEGGSLRVFTSKDGLPDDTAMQILDDGAGALWVSSNKGIYSVRKDALVRLPAGAPLAVTRLGTADGMRSAECNGGQQPAAIRARDGRLWFATGKGAVVVDPARMPANALPPPVAIEEALVDGRVATARPVDLAPGTKRLEIRYAGLSLRAPERVRFRYRLEGFDPGWLDAGSERKALYTNLPPGDFTFRVKAANEDGVWNDEGASLRLSVRPFFWQTSWFPLAAAAAIAGAAFALARVRVRRLVRQKRQLEETVRARTEDLRAANAELSLANGRLRQVEEKIAQMEDASAAALVDVDAWAARTADEIARSVGATRIAVRPAADVAAGSLPRLPAFETPGELVVPVTGISGDLYGALEVHGHEGAWGEAERRLLVSFSRQLGGALELKRMKEELALAERKRAASRQELLDAGAGVLAVCPECSRCYDETVTACAEDGAAPVEDGRLLPHRVTGRYELTRILGEGGMGVVFEARDARLSRDVALKIVRAEHLSTPSVRLRFEQEARALARIAHPNVIAIFDSGELPDGSLFLVMERLFGVDLGTLLERKGPGTPSEVAALLRQGAAALGAAHARGLLHRDVKPDNVFLVDAPEGRLVKLLDFGIAKEMRIDARLTETGMVVGTPAYMSPEQLQGKTLDARSDVYSFAAVSLEALSGEKWMPGEDFGEIFVLMLEPSVKRVAAILPSAPPAVTAAFASALAAAREERPGSVEAWVAGFVDALEAMPSRVSGWTPSRA